jgi:hypothetical protein
LSTDPQQAAIFRRLLAVEKWSKPETAFSAQRVEKGQKGLY